MKETEALINKQKAVELFKKQFFKIDQIKELRYDDPEVNVWHAINEEFINKAYGEAHQNLI